MNVRRAVSQFIPTRALHMHGLRDSLGYDLQVRLALIVAFRTKMLRAINGC